MRDKKERILNEKIADEKDILSLCRGMHDLLYHYKPAEWSDKKALAIVDEVSFLSHCASRIRTRSTKLTFSLPSTNPGDNCNGRQSNAPRDFEHGKGSRLH